MLALLSELAHVLVAIWFIGGLLGRTLALWYAERQATVKNVAVLTELAGRFENLMVIPGSLVLLVLGLLAAWAKGWPILGVLQGGSANWVLVSLLLYLSVIPVIRYVFIPGGVRFGQALDAALASDEVTPALRAAFADPAVRAGHLYEMAVVLVVLVLMVAKPF
jgi:uncharacterized membrane protein